MYLANMVAIASNEENTEIEESHQNKVKQIRVPGKCKYHHWLFT